MEDTNGIELDGKIYVAKEANLDDGCGGCAFRENSVLCLENPCFHGDRADGRNVIFIEKKEEVQLNNEDKKEDSRYDLINKGIMMFQCGDQGYATKVQNKLFEMGYRWSGQGPHIYHPCNLNSYVLYCKNMYITWSTSIDDSWDNHMYADCVIDEKTNEIMLVSDVKEDVGANSNSPDSFGVAEDKVNEGADTKPDEIGLKSTGYPALPAERVGLDCLFNQIVLLQKETDALSEQKEQIVNKISANTVAINILKGKMSELVSQVGLVFVGVDRAEGVNDEEPLNITDWWDLKVGDIVNVYGEDSRVCVVEERYYEGDYAFAVGCTEDWVDTSCDKWRFVSRPK